ncbi:MAG: hypothetical protein HYV09_02070 [Deltaproteobacteria bacterium]|nr:hypothetical protein [Deltaproteobacteria bacterium]
MKRGELEHLIRAACQIADDDELVIIGSQSILGAVPDAPASLLVSNEADVYPKNHPDRADLVDGTIGEGSPFHDTFGYYAQGVAEETAILPRGWKTRLVPVRNANTRDCTGWCLEPHDLVVAKYLAGRDKDLRFGREALEHRIVAADTLLQRLSETDVDEQRRSLARARIERDAKSIG